MQSPNATSATNSSIGYYLWLAAIGAIVYAYVFATSRAEMANTTLTSTVDASGNIMMNTGHRVITLLPFVWLYAVLTKAFTYKFNLFLTVATLIGLVFVSIGATQSNDPDAGMKITGSERTGWVTTNIVLLGIIGVCILLRIINIIKDTVPFTAMAPI